MCTLSRHAPSVKLKYEVDRYISSSRKHATAVYFTWHEWQSADFCQMTPRFSAWGEFQPRVCVVGPKFVFIRWQTLYPKHSCSHFPYSASGGAGRQDEREKVYFEIIREYVFSRKRCPNRSPSVLCHTLKAFCAADVRLLFSQFRYISLRAHNNIGDGDYEYITAWFMFHLINHLCSYVVSSTQLINFKSRLPDNYQSARKCNRVINDCGVCSRIGVNDRTSLHLGLWFCVYRF